MKARGRTPAATFTPAALRLLEQCRPDLMSAVLGIIRQDLKRAGVRVPPMARVLTPTQARARARADAYHASLGFGTHPRRKA